MKPQPPYSVLAALAFLAILSGCSSGPTSLTHPYLPQARFREVGVDLAPYRSAQLRPGQDPAIGVAVASSGGGLRAANLIAGVLLGLEELQREPGSPANALAEVDYFSSVSGSCLGVGAYLSSLRDHRTFAGPEQPYSLAALLAVPAKNPPPLAAQSCDPAIREHLGRNYTSDLLTRARALLTAGTIHRGHFLEQSFDDRILGHRWRDARLSCQGAPAASARRELTLGDLFPPASAPPPAVQLPIWVPNGTCYLNGAMFVFTPEHLKLYRVVEYTHRLKTVKADLADPANPKDDAERRRYDEFLAGFPLSVAMTTSNSFPAAVPPTVLRSTMDPDHPYLYLTDGGLSDNLAVYTALRMFKTEPHPGLRHKALLVVDARNDNYAAFGRNSDSPGALSSLLQTPLAQVLSWHNRYREVVEALCKSPDYAGAGTPIRPIFLDFPQLTDLPDCRPLQPLGFSPEARARLAARIKADPATVTPLALALDVGTSFGVSPDQQEFLLAVGRWLVAHNAPAIRAALGWPPAGSTPPGPPPIRAAAPSAAGRPPT